MEVQQCWRVRFFFRNATILVCSLNIVAAIFLLQGFLAAAYIQLRYIKESEEIRLAMLPLELIKRESVEFGLFYPIFIILLVREIQQEAYTEPEAVQKKETKQTAAVDLSKRLKDFHSLNDAASVKALEEWRKRKMERARQRQLEKNGTTTSQA